MLTKELKMKIMDELQKELQDLITLDHSALDDAQKSRLVELPNLIVQAGNAALEIKSKDFDSAVAQKEHFREKFEKSETEKRALEAKMGQNQGGTTDSIDQIKLGKKLVDYSDDELDFVVSFAGSKSPEQVLKALENPYVQQGIKAQREKVEKERAIKPSTRQLETDEEISLEQALAQAKTQDEKEKLLSEHMGYNIGNRPRSDKVYLGTQR